MGGTGILDQGDQVAAVGGIAHGHVHALVGDHPADDQVAGAEVAQYVVDGGGVENAGRGLGSTISLAVGSRASITLASGLPLGRCISDSL